MARPEPKNAVRGLFVSVLVLLLFVFSLVAFKSLLPGCTSPDWGLFFDFLILFAIDAIAVKRYVKSLTYLYLFLSSILVPLLITLLTMPIFCPAQLIYNCIPAPGYLCSVGGVLPLLGTNGNLSFIFGQSLGSNIYNVKIACTASTTPSGQPNPPAAMTNLSVSSTENKTFGNVVSIYTKPSVQGNLTVQSGQELAVIGLKCFDAEGNPLSNLSIGEAFTESLWVSYTQNSGPPNATTNVPYIEKYATLVLKVR